MDHGSLCNAIKSGVLAPLSNQRKNRKNLTRRDCLRLAAAGGMLPLGLSPWPLTNLGPNFGQTNIAMGQGSNPHRLLQIFLMGGWDGALSTDPAIGSKAVLNRYDRSYWDSGYGGYLGTNATQVGGSINPDLLIGYGLLPALNAFRSLPTTFVNGMFMEVTAHELAVNYMYTGQLSLSRSREYPAFMALMADQASSFPAHILLGGPMPLGSTRETNPPLQALDSDLLNMMMAGPKYQESPGDLLMQTQSIAAADSLIASLNQGFLNRLGAQSQQSVSAWTNAEQGLPDFYAKNFHLQMNVDPLAGDYGFSLEDKGSLEAKTAAGYLAIKSGISRFVTISMDGFDTHQNHSSLHLPLMNRVAVALNRLVTDLLTTPDSHPGAQPGDTLADNTTILLMSEFNRTPIYNQQGGTDHWTTSNAILMGRGVRANQAFGSTDQEGFALNRAGNARVLNSTDTGVLLPNHLAAAVLKHFGFAALSQSISSEDIHDDLFA